MSEFAVRMHGITKAFGGVQALKGVDFELRKGETHALLGGHGAGKSTVMKMLVGVNTPDAGTIEVDGREVVIPTPQAAGELGIGMIFQEFSLVPTLTVAQNIFLTREPRTGLGLLDDREAEDEARELFSEMEVELNPRALVRDLPTGLVQLTEIAKALSQQTRVLIMDEPSAALTNSETRSLFELMRRLKSQGIAIVYVSHRLEEIFEVADRITVFRDGRNVVTAGIADVDMGQMVEYIVGQKVSFEHLERPVDRLCDPLLEVEDLSSDAKVREVSFRLYPGEIVGVAGLMGSGRTELTQALFGIDHITSGQISVKGGPVAVHSPRDAMRAGIALVPEDRRKQGLVLQHAIRDNLLTPILYRLKKRGLVDDRKGDGIVKSFVDRLNIRTDSIRKRVGLLSGGNQQKVVIGKWLAAEPEILIMDEPTAGVDIGAKSEIIDIIRNLADQGKGVIVVSSEIPELLAMSDRILVMRAGTLYREVDRKELAGYAASAATGNGKTQLQAEEEALNHIIQGVVVLTPDEVAKVREMNATAAIVMHYGDNDWSRTQVAGLESEFGRLGIRVLAVTDANFSSEGQVADIEKVLAQRPDIIVSIPTDPVATAPAYLKAAEQGVKIVFMDNVPEGMAPGRDYVSVVSSDNFGNGVAGANLMAAALGKHGKVGIVFHAADFSVTEQRWQGFKTTIQKNYPNIQIVDEKGIKGPDFAREAEEAADGMLAKYPDLKGIWAVWDIPAEGVLAAARARGRDDLVVTTVDLGLKVALHLAKGDLVKGIGAQRTFDQGVTEAVMAAYGLLGKPAPPYVALPPLSVTKSSVLQAWTTVYHQEPPAELAQAVQW
ncbi:MAG: ATP-binding cassette domain-containing protein [Acidimicrobiia bacterium]